VAGRLLDEAHGDEASTDESKTANIVVSREAARMLGFKSPEDALDKTAYSGKQPLHIVGVIETRGSALPKVSCCRCIITSTKRAEERAGSRRAL